MPVIPAVARDSIDGFNAAGDPRGQRSTRISFQTTKGVPRREDLITIRSLEQTHTVSLPIDTIQQQVSTTPWAIVPDVDDVTSQHEAAAADAEELFRTAIDASTFDSWMKQLVNGILSINAGVVEKVPREDGYLGEMYVRDGATFTRAPDKFGRLPAPPEPAYWQFSLHGSVQPFSWTDPLRELADEVGTMGYGRFSREPIPFSQDEIVWMAEDGKEWHEYGFGRVQKVRNLVEIILNQDISNKKYFPANEVPEGIVNIVEASQEQVQEVREWWNDEIKGQRHKVGILGGNGSDIEWMPFRATPDELEFIESQQWYNKLVWMVFGLNQNEVGDLSEVTRPGGSEQFAAKIWHRTTKPLLELIKNHIETELLAYTEPYDRVDGELRWEWQHDNPEIERLRRERQTQDLDKGLKTVNEVRQERGESELPWGDLPQPLQKSVARNFPRWALEQWADVDEDNLPDPQPVGGDPLGLDAGVDGDAPGRDVGSVADRLGVEVREDPLADVVKDESLRNEYWRGEFPPLAGHIDDLEQDVGTRIQEAGDDLADALEDHWPETDQWARGETKDVVPDLDAILESVGLADVLERVVAERNVDAMGESADWHAGQLEDEIAERVDDEMEVEISFDVEDTLAREFMERRTAQRMVSVEESVKARIQRTLLDVADGEHPVVDDDASAGNVSDATEALREEIDELSDSHSRLVARTETLDASRHGSQAMSESSDVIAKKDWVATDDSRTRNWHAAMDDADPIPVDDKWTVPQLNADGQPADYPRSTQTVGGDQPYNCRCGQRPVLDEDLPSEAAAINRAFDDVLVYGRTVRMREVAAEHQQRGETFAKTLERVIDEAGSRTQATEVLGISKPTLYKWADGGLAKTVER